MVDRLLVDKIKVPVEQLELYHQGRGSLTEDKGFFEYCLREGLITCDNYRITDDVTFENFADNEVDRRLVRKLSEYSREPDSDLVGLAYIHNLLLDRNIEFHKMYYERTAGLNIYNGLARMFLPDLNLVINPATQDIDTLMTFLLIDGISLLVVSKPYDSDLLLHKVSTYDNFKRDLTLYTHSPFTRASEYFSFIKKI